MKKLLTILFTLATMACFSQSNYVEKDTTIGGWNVRMRYRSGFFDSTNLFVHINGLGEVGSDTSKFAVYGPFYWFRNGWDGGITLADGQTRYPVYAVLQPPAGYPQPAVVIAKIDALVSRFKVRAGCTNLSGLSNGGYAIGNLIYYEPTLHDHTYPNKIRCIMLMASERHDDNFGGDPYTYPNYMGHGAKVAPNLRVIAFEQFNDGRNQDVIIKRMMDSTGNTTRFPFFWTNFGAGGHSNFNDMCSPFQTNWTLTNPDVQSTNGGAIATNPIATGQNVWQWMLRQNADTSMPGGNVNPDVNAGPDITKLIPLTSLTLTGTASDPDGSITSTVWSKDSGPSCTITAPTSLSTSITGLSYGTYVFRLTATDNSGGTSFDLVTVNNGIPCSVASPVTYTLTTTSPGEIYITDASGRGWKGGDTLLIPSGTYSVIEIDSFGGDPCRPIIIKNSGGQVVVTTAIRFKSDVHYVTIIGNGTPGLTYGFKTKSFTFSRASWFTMSRIEIGPNPDGVGIYGKQDPSGQPADEYPNYLMRKITIDSCYINDVAGEGLYIGHTYPNGDPAYSNRIPIRLDSVRISNCIIDSTGWDGIQLSNARDGCLIYNNTVTNFGLLDIDAQRAGIISGGNTNSKIYNNSVSSGKGNGIQIFGYGVIECYNNTVTNVGNTVSNANGEESIYGHDPSNTVETNPQQQAVLYNNQINHPKLRGAIKFNNNGSILPQNVHDNRFCFAVNPGGSWQSTYLLLTPGSSNINNILLCTDYAIGRVYRIKVKN